MIIPQNLSRHKRTLPILGCLGLLVTAGFTGWLLWPSNQPTVQGQWSGTITVAAPGVPTQSHPATASLTQSGQQVTGTITTDQPSAVSGVIQGSSLTLNTNNQTAITLKLENQHLSGSATIAQSGQNTTIAIELSRVSSTPLPAASIPPIPSPVSASLNLPTSPTAPEQPVSTTGSQPPAQPPILLGVNSVSLTNGVAVAAANDPNSMYGTDMLQDRHAADGNGQWSETPVTGLRFAQWTFNASGGQYQVVATYAAAQSRPLSLVVNGTVVSPNAFSAATGGWFPQNRMAMPLATVALVSGINTIQISCAPNQAFPHVEQLMLTAISGN